MVDNVYRYIDIPPCTQGSNVQVGSLFFRVKAIEPLYYEFRNMYAGLEVGFSTGIYQVPDLIPPKDHLYYITAFGLQGVMSCQIRYQSGSPRNTVGARAIQRLTFYQAPFDAPFTDKFVIVAGDTLEVDLVTTYSGQKSAVWFYGYKLKVSHLDKPPAQVVVLEDVREFSR